MALKPYRYIGGSMSGILRDDNTAVELKRLGQVVDLDEAQATEFITKNPPLPIIPEDEFIPLGFTEKEMLSGGHGLVGAEKDAFTVKWNQAHKVLADLKKPPVE